MAPPDIAACIGTFHLPRHADFARLRHALARAPQVRVFLAGAHRPRSPRHPFTWEERAHLLQQGLGGDERQRVQFHPLREGVGAERTRAELAQAVPAGAQVLLVAGASQEGSWPVPPGWNGEALPGIAEPVPESVLREQLLSAAQPATALAALQADLPPHVLQFLRDWSTGPDYAHLREEYQQIAREKAAWSVAPYPVVLVTVDAVVRAAGHVLLIRRGQAPGKGLRALPGGFLDVHETVRESALRELAEETRLDLPELQSALRGVQVFDDPQRSQRGRVITHAHFFDLGERPLPGVRGDDDAAAAEWVPIDQLPGLEAAFMDDHFLILDHFLGLLPTANDPPSSSAPPA